MMDGIIGPGTTLGSEVFFMNITRRQFLAGGSAALAALAGGRIGSLAFAQDDGDGRATGTDEILVLVFLRGGCDGLSLVAPFDDPNYTNARFNLIIPPDQALVIDPQNSTFTSRVGLHPQAGPLQQLYTAGNLAIVHACGLTADTRSHTEAAQTIARGNPNDPTITSGWLARHLQCSRPDGLLPTLVPMTEIPAALQGDTDAVTMTTAESYGEVKSHWRYRDTMLTTLKQMYSGAGYVNSAGTRALGTIELLKTREREYTPDVDYPYTSFGDALKLVAQIVKLDMGLQVATLDFDGWDTHDYQGEYGSGYLATLVTTLANGLSAFSNDLAAYQNRLTVVVMSEFGRSLWANPSQGTDHGRGGVMLVLGGNVNGGKIYGNWPGLAGEDLEQGRDLRVTTDFRTILSEIVVRRLGNPKLGCVFPGFDRYEPLGVVSGPDLEIDYTPPGNRTIYLPLVTR
jgi:uncharacterized protein (DUF1501 family)